VPSLVVDNASAGHTAKLEAETRVTGTTTIKGNATLDLNGRVLRQVGATLTNDGTLDGRTTGSVLRFQGSAAQTYEGGGAVPAPLRTLALDNPAGLTIDNGIPNNIVTRRAQLMRGTLTHSGKLTLGDGGLASTEIGGVGVNGAGGSFDAAPNFNVLEATYDVSYLNEGQARSTGHEIPATRSVGQLVIANPAGVTLTGGALKVHNSLKLDAGLLTTTAGNKLKLRSPAAPAGSDKSYVNGPMEIEYATQVPQNINFAVGKQKTAGLLPAFRPVTLKNVNT